MKITLITKEAASVLARCIKALMPKPIIVQDGNVLISAVKDGICFCSTDGEMSIMATIPAGGDNGVTVDEPGEFTVDARKLLEMLNSFSEDKVSLETVSETNAVLRYANGRQEMPVFDSGDYRKMSFEAEDPVRVVIPASLLTDALSSTLFNCTSDPLRPALGCVLIETSENGGHIVTTDSRSLMIQDIPDLKTETPIAFMLPQKQGNLLLATMKALKEEDDIISISFGKSNAVFKAGDTVISIKATLGKFPNWKAVVPDPAQAPAELKIEKDALLSTLKRVSICSSSTTRCVKMTFSRDLMDSNMELSAEDKSFSISARENIPVEYEGEKISIGFNAELLGDIVRHIACEKIKVYIYSDRKPVLIVPEEQKETKATRAVLVPIKFR